MSMSDWNELCSAAGLPVQKMQTIDVFLYAKRILDDEELRQLALPSIVNGVLPIGTRAAILRAMPEAQKAALRGRIWWLGTKPPKYSRAKH